MFVQNPTDEQNILRAERIKKLQNERTKLIKKNNDDVEAFESALEDLRNYRHELLSGLKLTVLRYKEFGDNEVSFFPETTSQIIFS